MMPNLSRRGLPYPFLITPRDDNEARCGTATLLTDGHIHTLVGALKGSRKWNDVDLIEKLEELRDS